MKLPLSSITSLATNLRVAIEAKDTQLSNELYEQFKQIVDYNISRIESSSKEKKTKNVVSLSQTRIPKCNKTLKEAHSQSSLETMDKRDFQITELNLHYWK